MSNNMNQHCFIDCISAVIETSEVHSMKQWRHHFSVTTYDHSVFVSYVSYRLARRLNLDYMAAARAGLLHDFYLYDGHDKTAHPGNQCLDHPVAALQNAKVLCPDLTPKEENIIISHMWPLAKKMPRSREAFVVSLADKACAVLEVSRVFRLNFVQHWLPHQAIAAAI